MLYAYCQTQKRYSSMDLAEICIDFATTKVTWWRRVVVLSLLCLVASPVSYCLPLARSAKRLPLCLGGLYFIILTQLITYESLFTLLWCFIPIPGGITLFLSKSWTMRWLPLGYLLVLISYSISVTILSQLCWLSLACSGKLQLYPTGC